MSPHETAIAAFRDAGISNIPLNQLNLYVEFEVYKRAMRIRTQIRQEDRDERLEWADGWQKSIINQLVEKKTQRNKRRRQQTHRPATP